MDSKIYNFFLYYFNSISTALKPNHYNVQTNLSQTLENLHILVCILGRVDIQSGELG